MELIRGEGLNTILLAGRSPCRMPPDGARRCVTRWQPRTGPEFCTGTSKPSKVLLTQSGTVKILDCGVARAVDNGTTADRLTQTGFLVGTPAYMAPEQARSLPEPRSDLYTIGCLLFEMITGQLPFQAPDAVGQLSAHLVQEPPAPTRCPAISHPPGTSWY